ncbi:MAG: NADH:flavin oxidoreductase/NADH oxidase [Rhodospirillaceae bacterium]|nr:NADH:flavin oxidoreductase/NADH oxidase [Rhodospirillaceae bacterium]
MSTAQTPLLFTPLKLRELTLKNRLCLSPMCTYGAQDGMAGDWHLVHLGQYALGGWGIVFVEATAVEERGRITYGDVGLWKDAQIAPLKRVTQFLRQHGAAPAIQLAHAGRKSSTARPWHGMGILKDADAKARGENPWKTVSSTPDLMDDTWHEPHALSTDELKGIVESWRAAARRAREADFDIVEVHCAHGYLMHQFLSPLINKRNDAYGGDIAGRMRLPLEVAEAVRGEWPKDKPVFVRISSIDGMDGGWTIEDSVTFSKELKARGIDVIDCSSGGVVGSATARAVPRFFGFQVPFAETVRKGAGMKTMAVGLIVDPEHAENILQTGQADIIAVAREALVDPYWAHHAARALSPELMTYADWNKEYQFWLDKREPVMRKLRAEGNARA